MKENSHRLDQQLAEILSEYVDLLNAGVAPPVEEYLRRHGNLAAELRPLFETATAIGKEASKIVPSPAARARFTQVRAQFVAEREGITSPVAPPQRTVAMAVDRRPDFLILLLHSLGEVWGITKLCKLLFLLGKEGNAARHVPDYYAHVAYNFGPFEEAIYRDLDALKAAGVIEERKQTSRKRQPDEELDEGLYPEKVDAIYRLTQRGRKDVAEALAKAANAKDPAILASIREISQKYGSLRLRQLLKYVYQQYPEFAKKSKIRDEILGSDE